MLLRALGQPNFLCPPGGLPDPKLLLPPHHPEKGLWGGQGGWGFLSAVCSLTCVGITDHLNLTALLKHPR